VSFSGVSGGDGQYHYAFDFGGDHPNFDGPGDIAPGANYASATAPIPAALLDDGDADGTPVPVRGRVYDGAGAFAERTFTVQVGNVVPTAAITGVPASLTVGQQVTLGSTVTDPSLADTAAGFTYQWTLTLDGSPAPADDGLTGPTLKFTPTQTMGYMATLQVRDKDDAPASTGQTAVPAEPCSIASLPQPNGDLKVWANGILDALAAGTLSYPTPGGGAVTGAEQIANDLALRHSDLNVNVLPVNAVNAGNTLAGFLAQGRGYAFDVDWSDWIAGNDGTFNNAPDDQDWHAPGQFDGGTLQCVHFLTEPPGRTVKPDGTGYNYTYGLNAGNLAGVDVGWVKKGANLISGTHVGFGWQIDPDFEAILWLLPNGGEAFFETIRWERNAQGQRTSAQKTSVSTNGGIGLWTVTPAELL